MPDILAFHDDLLEVTFWGRSFERTSIFDQLNPVLNVKRPIQQRY